MYSDTGNNPVGLNRSICKVSCHVHVSYPVPSTFNYRPLFLHSSLLLKKISTDVLCLRGFPHQPHKTSCPQPFAPRQHPEPPWAHWPVEAMERRPIMSRSSAGWPRRLSGVRTRHRPLPGGYFPSPEFPKRKSKSVGLKSSLLPKHQTLFRAGEGARAAHGRCNR